MLNCRLFERIRRFLVFRLVGLAATRTRMRHFGKPFSTLRHVAFDVGNLAFAAATPSFPIPAVSPFATFSKALTLHDHTPTFYLTSGTRVDCPFPPAAKPCPPPPIPLATLVH